MLTHTDWVLNTAAIRREVVEDDLFVLTPYKNSITIMLRHGTVLVHAKHDGTDEGSDMETLKMLCLYRFNNGGQDV